MVRETKKICQSNFCKITPLKLPESTCANVIEQQIKRNGYRSFSFEKFPTDLLQTVCATKTVRENG